MDIKELSNGKISTEKILTAKIWLEEIILMSLKDELKYCELETLEKILVESEIQVHENKKANFEFKQRIANLDV